MPNGKGKGQEKSAEARGKAGGKGLDKEHVAVHPDTGEEIIFTQREWKDKAFREDLIARGFVRQDDEDEAEESGEDEPPMEPEEPAL